MTWEGAAVSRLGEMVTETLEMGEMVLARHRIPRGFDSAPHYRGLPNDMCPCEHWIYLASGELSYRFAEGGALTVRAGDAAHVRGGHLADALEDSVLIELTRAEDFRRKAEHLAGRDGTEPEGS
jgi:hypothetical protein